MQRIISIIILIFSFNFIYGQQYNQTLTLSAGRSFNGTGDTDGFGYEMMFTKYYNKWSLSGGFGGSIHDKNVLLITTITQPNGSSRTIDGSVRSTIAGLQLQALCGYSFIKKGRSNAQVNLGPIIRYQSSSYPDDYEILFPALTGLPIPVVSFNNENSARSVAIGGLIQLQYNYNFTKKYYAGLKFFLQKDTHGELIRGSFLNVGRTF